MNRLRDSIYALMEEIPALDVLERDQIESTLRWIASGVELCRIIKPAIPDKHLVSYFILLDPEQGKFLLVDHIKAELWLPPGGHVEPGEHPKETVIREVKEELGIEADFLSEKPLFLTVTKTSGKTAGHTDVTLWYLLKGSCCDILNYDKEEFHAIRWFQPHEFPENSDPHLKRFIAKWTAHGINKFLTL